MLRDKIYAENKGVVIPVPVRWLASPYSIRERRQRGEISMSSVVFVVKWDKVVGRPVEEGIKVAGVWYTVEPFTNVGPDSRRDHCCGWGHIESNCSANPTCGYSSGPHRTRTFKCIAMRCIAKPGSLCGHTQEKCPNCNGNHIMLSNRCATKAEGTRDRKA
jgi:hypothetical protein